MDLVFPPLMTGEATATDPFEQACLKAIQGCDAGLICHRLTANRLEAAIVFAPEVPLEQAMIMLPICGIGFQNALGALAPPEVAVHLEWDGPIRINGARCGALKAAASTTDPAETPDWLTIGLSLPLWPEDDTADPGERPDETTLYAEGCVDVAAPSLLEAIARHTLAWIGQWEERGAQTVHAEWRGLAHGVGEDITIGTETGTFLGVDENFGLLLRQSEETTLIPLSSQLVTP